MLNYASTYETLDTKPKKQIAPGCLVKTTRFTPYTFFGKKQFKNRSGLYSPMKLSMFGDCHSIEVPMNTCMMFLSLQVRHKHKTDTIGNGDIFTGQARALLEEQIVYINIPYNSDSYQGALKNSYNFLYHLFEVVD